MYRLYTSIPLCIDSILVVVVQSGCTLCGRGVMTTRLGSISGGSVVLSGVAALREKLQLCEIQHTHTPLNKITYNTIVNNTTLNIIIHIIVTILLPFPSLSGETYHLKAG